MNEGLTLKTGPEKPKELEELERISREIVMEVLDNPSETSNSIVLASLALQTGGVVVNEKINTFRLAMKRCLDSSNLDSKIKALLQTEYEKLQIREGL